MPGCASQDKVTQHVLFQQLAQALGLPSPTALPEGGVTALRYERIVLLFDPDADGIHIGALVQLYFARWLPAVVEAGLLCLCRAPMYELVDADGVVHHALTPDHRQRIEQSLRARRRMRRRRWCARCAASAVLRPRRCAACASIRRRGWRVCSAPTTCSRRSICSAAARELPTGRGAHFFGVRSWSKPSGSHKSLRRAMRTPPLPSVLIT